MAEKIMHNDDLKYANKLSILRILREGPISRAELAARLHMSKSTISGIVEDFIGDGFVKVIGRGKSTAQGGKKPVLLEMNERAALIVAVYFSYRLVEVAIADLKGEFLCRNRLCVETVKPFHEQCDCIVSQINLLLAELNDRGITQRPMAGGIVVKGLVDSEQGILLYSATLPGWKKESIAAAMGKAIGIPFFVENDVRAITSYQLDAFRNSPPRVMMCVNAERGVGVGLAINNKIFYGAHFGVSTTHMILKPDGPVCSCGNRGCWDRLTSADYMLEQIAQHDPSLTALSYEQVATLYRNGHPAVCDVIDHEVGYWMNIGIQNAVNCYNPDVVVLIGCYFSDFPAMRDAVIHAIHSMPNLATHGTRVLVAEPEEDIFLKSAASIVFMRFFSTRYYKKLTNSIQPVTSPAVEM